MTVFFLVSNQQHWGKEGDFLYVDRLSGDVGASVAFDKVLCLDKKVGNPYIEKASVTCEIIKQGKEKKMRIIKFISQKRHRKVKGFRKQYTKLKITKIEI